MLIFRSSKFDKKAFSSNYWSTKYYNYRGSFVNAYNTNTNTIFMILRETKPFDLEDIIIGRVDLQTGSTDQSSYLDTEYTYYSHLHFFK